MTSAAAHEFETFGDVVATEYEHSATDPLDRTHVVRSHSRTLGAAVSVLWAPTSRPGMRANTADTVRLLSRTDPTPRRARILAVTSPHFVPFQHADLISDYAIPYGTIVETVGFPENWLAAPLPPHHLLQEIRSASPRRCGAFFEKLKTSTLTFAQLAARPHREGEAEIIRISDRGTTGRVGPLTTDQLFAAADLCDHEDVERVRGDKTRKPTTYALFSFASSPTKCARTGDNTARTRGRSVVFCCRFRGLPARFRCRRRTTTQTWLGQCATPNAAPTGSVRCEQRRCCTRSSISIPRPGSRFRKRSTGFADFGPSCPTWIPTTRPLRTRRGNPSVGNPEHCRSRGAGVSHREAARWRGWARTSSSAGTTAVRSRAPGPMNAGLFVSSATGTARRTRHYSTVPAVESARSRQDPRGSCVRRAARRTHSHVDRHRNLASPTQRDGCSCSPTPHATLLGP